MENVAPQDEKTRLLKHIEDIGNRDVDSGQAAEQLLAYLASPDLEIVLSALHATFNYVKEESLFRQVLALARSHADEEVRGMANSCLGPLLRDGLGHELDLPEAWHVAPPAVRAEFYAEIKEHLFARVDALMESMEVRRRCVEALGYLAYKPEVHALVLRFYHQAPNPWVKVSALFAMALYRDPIFERLVLESLHSPHEHVLLEAVHAAGTLELAAARHRLAELAAGAHAEIRYEAIVSLGMSGMPQAVLTFLGDLEKRFPDAETGEAIAVARKTAEQRSKIVAGDPLWDDGLIMSEINDMIADASGEK